MAAAFCDVRPNGLRQIEDLLHLDDPCHPRGVVLPVYDPKGELFAQTAGSAKRLFRLDLNDPAKSDRWNFVPKCRNDPAFACQIAGMMIGIENRRQTNADPFWGDAEQIALTAILLHIAEVYRKKAIPAFAADFLLSLGENGTDTFAQAMENSPSLYAKQAYLAFRQAPIQTRGSILIGLYNKLRPFTLAPARMVTMPPTQNEIELGCRTIDFAELRKAGTAHLSCSLRRCGRCLQRIHCHISRPGRNGDAA